MSTSRRSWRRSATPSSPSCTRVLVVCPVACPTVCPVASLAPAVLPQVAVAHLGPPLRRSIKMSHQQPEETT